LTVAVLVAQCPQRRYTGKSAKRVQPPALIIIESPG